MKNFNILIAIINVCLFTFGFPQAYAQAKIEVTTASELEEAIDNAGPGSDIILSDGVWNDIQIEFYGFGTKEAPITLRANSPGKVFISGQSNLKLGGEYLIVDGLHFINGASPSRAVIQYHINQDTLAYHCRVTNCVIENFNKAQRNMVDVWVSLKGRHNEFDHCYLAGKSNKGPTIRVDIAGNRSINNYHQIHHNHFGPRPPKGGPSAETIQIGDSYTSVSPSHTMVFENLFDRCDGEVEVISSKTNYNEFRNNVFYKSEGSLVTRHGNYCVVDGNYFIGEENSSKHGGVRLIGTGHWVTNNYFYNLKGEIFRAPLAVMNGIKKSPLNRYLQVTDVVVAHNTYVDCTSPWQFGVGSNIDQKDVLPASEIRSETPIRTIVANNLIYNTKGDPMPIFRHDSIQGIKFKSNLINNNGVNFKGVEGLQVKDFSLSEVEQDIWVSIGALDEVEVYNGFDFDKISIDLFGNDRNNKNSVGANCAGKKNQESFMNLSNYGPEWFDSKPKKLNPMTHQVSNSQELMDALGSASNGDLIQLTSKTYEINSPLQINKSIVIESAKGKKKSKIIYKGEVASPAFVMYPKGDLTLRSIELEGTGQNHAFATLEENMSSHYNLKVEASEISNFDFVLKAYKFSFAQHISFNSCVIKNCNNGIELSGEDDDRGDYNAENVTIVDCTFEHVKQNVIDYYRGGYDESTIGGTLTLKGSTFKDCGALEKNETLINTYGIINVDIIGNTFTNNQVKKVAQLWGAKNNSESKNTIKDSGKIVTLQNLPQKLMY